MPERTAEANSRGEQEARAVVETFRLDPPAEQAARRRAQLIRVAAHLVVTRGVDAASHASVAELAGCARSLVYRYFPQREDLLYALLSTFEAELDERFVFSDSIAGFLGLKDVRGEYVPAATSSFAATLWKPEDWQQPTIELRLACVILMRDSNLKVALGAHGVELQQSLERRLLGPLQGLGLTDIEAWIVVDAVLSSLHHVTRAVWAGEMTPDEGLELLWLVSSRMLQTFTE